MLQLYVLGGVVFRVGGVPRDISTLTVRTNKEYEIRGGSVFLF